MESKGLIWVVAGVLLLCLCVSGVSAVVAGGGPCTHPGICNGVNGYSTIQDAIDDASAGDTITVDSGSYAPFIVDKPLTIQGIKTAPTNLYPFIYIGDHSGVPPYPFDNVIKLTSTAHDVNLDGFRLMGYGSGPSGQKGTGVYIDWDSSSNVVSNVDVESFDDGIKIDGGDNNRIESCTVKLNKNGITLRSGSDHNTIDGCRFSNGDTSGGSPSIGVNIYESSYNTVMHSNISQMTKGISLVSSEGESMHNMIFDNTLEWNSDTYSMALYLNAPDNIINWNTITNNYAGIVIDSRGENNQIYANNFLQGSEPGTEAANVNRFPGNTNVLSSQMKGNYWANTLGTGFSQTCPDVLPTGGDGICDDHLVLDSTNVDNLPLAHTRPFPTHPKAAFSADITYGDAPLNVQFTDESIFSTDYSGWLWKFDDTSGTTYSSLQNPTHTYTQAGTYGVTLTVTDNTERDVITRTDYITVTGSAAPAPIVNKITPNVGSDMQSSWPVTIEGANFNLDNGFTVALENPATGFSELVLAEAGSDSSTIYATFDLTQTSPIAITPGSYNVVVYNPDLQSGKLIKGFTVAAESKLGVANYDPTKKFPLYAGPQMNGGEPVITWDGSFNVPPYPGQLFLKDPTPMGNWEKSVTFYYVYTVQGTPTITPIASNSPPKNIDMPLIDGRPYKPDGSGFVPIPAPYTMPAACTNGFATNNYALLISGGVAKEQNNVRYYNDISNVYTVLTQNYCYNPAQITVLYSDGNTNGVTDTLYAYGPPSTYTPQYRDTSLSVFSTDGATVGAATSASLDTALSTYKSNLPAAAKLFIYVDNHGATTGDLLLWPSGASITPANFVGKLPTQIDTIMMVMEQCYGGAFITPFTTATWTGGNQNQKRYIMTAATSGQVSISNSFAQAWITAVSANRPTMKASFTTASSNDVNKLSETPSDGVKSGTDATTLYLGDLTTAKSIKVKSPNGGETWQQMSSGNTFKNSVTWSTTGMDNSNTVKIELWTVGGASAYQTIIASTPATSGSFGWQIPGSYTVGNNYLIKITCNQDTSVSGTSAAAFTIAAAGSKGSFAIQTVNSAGTALTGAKIYINDYPYSTPTTPGTVGGIPINTDQRIRVELPTYYAPEGTYKLTSATTQTVTIKLFSAQNDVVPYVTLGITSTPPGAVVKIQDMTDPSHPGPIIDTGIRTPGTTPVYTDPDHPSATKTYKVSASLDGYDDAVPVTVNVNKDTIAGKPADFTLPVSLTLKAKTNVPGVKTLILPNPLNLGKSNSYFLAVVKLPTGYLAADVKAESVYCEKAPALKVIRSKLLPQYFIAIFSRQDLGTYSTGKYPMNVKGLVMKSGAYYPFLASDTVNVVNIKGQKEDCDNVMSMTDTQIFTNFNKL